MRLVVNSWTNVVTGEHSRAYRQGSRDTRPQITIPSFSKTLSIEEAEQLAAALAEAVIFARELHGPGPQLVTEK